MKLTKITMKKYKIAKWERSKQNHSIDGESFDSKVSFGYLGGRDNERGFMDWLGSQLGFKKMEDWYMVKKKDIRDKGGALLLTKYGGSPYNLVRSVYPEYPWKKSETGPENNERNFMDRLGKELGIMEKEGWYQVTKMDIDAKGGTRMLSKYRSLSQMVCSIYSEHQWKMWRFKRVVHGTWSHLKTPDRVEIIQWLGKELKIGEENLEEWYSVSWFQLGEKISLELFKKYPLEQLLREGYPDYSWDTQKLQAKRSGKMRSSQRMLTRMIKEVFSNAGLFK
jgi:hypothetical protein